MREHFTDREKLVRVLTTDVAKEFAKQKKDIRLDILLQIPATSYFPRQLPTKYHQR